MTRRRGLWRGRNPKREFGASKACQRTAAKRSAAGRAMQGRRRRRWECPPACFSPYPLGSCQAGARGRQPPSVQSAGLGTRRAEDGAAGRSASTETASLSRGCLVGRRLADQCDSVATFTSRTLSPELGPGGRWRSVPPAESRSKICGLTQGWIRRSRCAGRVAVWIAFRQRFISETVLQQTGR